METGKYRGDPNFVAAVAERITADTARANLLARDKETADRKSLLKFMAERDAREAVWLRDLLLDDPFASMRKISDYIKDRLYGQNDGAMGEMENAIADATDDYAIRKARFEAGDFKEYDGDAGRDDGLTETQRYAASVGHLQDGLKRELEKIGDEVLKGREDWEDKEWRAENLSEKP